MKNAAAFFFVCLFVVGFFFIASDGTTECRERQRSQSVTEQSGAYAALRRCKAIRHELKCCVECARTRALMALWECRVVGRRGGPTLGAVTRSFQRLLIRSVVCKRRQVMNSSSESDADMNAGTLGVIKMQQWRQICVDFVRCGRRLQWSLPAILFNVRRPTCWVEHSAAHGIKFIDNFSSI